MKEASAGQHTWCTRVRDVHWTQKSKQGKPASTKNKRPHWFVLGLVPSCHKRVRATAVPVLQASQKSSALLSAWRDTALTPACADGYRTPPAPYPHLPSDCQHSLGEDLFLLSPASSPTHSLLSRAPSRKDISNLMRGQTTIPGIHTRYSLSFLKDSWAPPSTIADTKMQGEEESDQN